MSAEEKLAWQIVNRRQAGIEALIDDCLTRQHPVRLLNNVLLPAMKTVGDLFGQGQLILPYVLQSAEVMKKAVAHLEQFLDKQEGTTRGTVVLATVYGDVHEIGKNLVGTILANNGYTVIDLGIQVPANVIIDEAVGAGADAIGLSALLVSTSKQMPLIVRELDRRGLNLPVLVGGAAINRRFGRWLMFLDDHYYEAGVVYCQDAFAGLEALQTLTNPGRAPDFIKKLHDEAAREVANAPVPPAAPAVIQSAWKPAAIPTPPFWGARTLLEIPLSEVFPHLDTTALFRLSWGARNTRGEQWEKLREEFEARVSLMQSEAQRRGWLRPQGVYGYWPCQSQAESLILYSPGTTEEIGRFDFPRQSGQDRLCLADYFAPVASGIMDVVALQVVTVGAEATSHCEARPGGRRLQRRLFCPRAGGADGGGRSRLAAPADQAGTGHRGPGPAVFVGLRHLPRADGPHPGIQTAAGRRGPGPEPDLRLSIGAGAEHRGPDRPLSGGEVFYGGRPVLGSRTGQAIEKSHNYHRYQLLRFAPEDLRGRTQGQSLFNALDLQDIFLHKTLICMV